MIKVSRAHMKNGFRVLFGVICLGVGVVTQAKALETSPVTVFDLRYVNKIDRTDLAQVTKAWDHCHTVAALQGLVNRDAPLLYLRYVESQHRSQNVDDYWLKQLSESGQWLAGRTQNTVSSLEDLVSLYRPMIKGVVLYDPAVAATSNVASTVCGVEGLLPIRFDPTPGSLYDQLVVNGPRLPVKVRLIRADGSSMFTGKGLIPGMDRPSTGSAKCDAYLWMKHFYMDTGRVNGAFGAYYLDQYWMRKPQNSVLNHHCLTNHDYFISHKAFFFDLHVWADETPIDDPDQKAGTDLATLKELLLSAYEHGGKENMIHIGGFVPWA